MSTQGYDLIGDIHGQDGELVALLDVLGYGVKFGVYEHPSRKVIFLGDWIDRGAGQREVLAIARGMIDAGTALAVMGNHEYNAIAYATPAQGGGYLRPHNEKNTGQHQAFLDAFESDPSGWEDTVRWFAGLPMWLDLEGLRVIHACWDEVMMQRVLAAQGGSNLLGTELLHSSSQEGTWQHQAIETLLKGKEVLLPEGSSFADKDGNRRQRIRVRWWDQTATTYRRAYMGPSSARAELPDEPILEPLSPVYGAVETPVFLGHYWMEGAPALLAPNIACLDYSVAKPGGRLVAYRWSGEQVLREDNFRWVRRS